jgi:CHAD domain-containing protein
MSDVSPMESFAIRKTQELIDSSVFTLHEAVRLHDAGAVHRMRVAVRKLQQALRVFRQYFKPSGVRRVRRQLKKCVGAAGELRNYDIAMELLDKYGFDVPEVHAKRTTAKKEFRTVVRQLTKHDLGLKWRSELGLPS